MRVRVAECASMFWDEGQLVWDDYLHQRQFALTQRSEVVLRWFATWRKIETIESLDPGLEKIALHLLDAGVLVAEGSVSDREERRVVEGWRHWGPSARQYHFASRSRAEDAYLSLAEDRELARSRSESESEPELCKSYQDCPFVEFPAVDDVNGWTSATLQDVLAARRSVRDFAESAISLAELGVLLDAVGGVVSTEDDADGGRAVFKSSPSAGARNPIELYVYAQRVDGLARGLHHYSPQRRGLEELGVTRTDSERLAAFGGQPWLVDAAAVVLYTAVLERSQWRYRSPRAYRDVCLGAGHTSQTFLLTATALGLGAVFATAVCDDALETMLGIDGIGEIVLGAAGVGLPAEREGA